MLKIFFSVSSLTLLSRITGFVRDVFIASSLGAGFMADAFFVALRLPNHFRAIFAEGAFNKAFIPTYTETRYSHVSSLADAQSAQEFTNRLWTFMIVCQAGILALALLAMPLLIRVIAPGLAEKIETYTLAVSLTRITFPYLACMSLVTLVSGILNVMGHFAIPALTSTVMNLTMIASLLFVFFFPSPPAYALAWGVAASGVLQLVLVLWDSHRLGVRPQFAWPSLDPHIRSFFRRLLPVTIGSAGVQLALFLDTILASLLPTGSVSGLYYADRLYQLPIGLIGIAIGTILLPTMSRAFSERKPQEAHRAQNRSLALSFALSMPWVILFLLLPEMIVRVLFEHGAFSPRDTALSSAILSAYALGIPAVILIQGVVPSFYAHGDMRTPVIISLISVAVNVLLKILLVAPLDFTMGLWKSLFSAPFGAAGLALATSCGAWINLILLWVLASRRAWMSTTSELKRVAICALGASCGLGGLFYGFVRYFPAHAQVSFWHEFGFLALILSAGAVLYSALFFWGAYSLRVSWRSL
jgi:putative peptidoglycan lipid II flippase